MKKRGQFQLSFGMIFSIILIVAALVVAFYVISYFLNFQKCAQIGFFYKDLQGNVDDAWQSDLARESVSISMPSGIEEVCFGNLTQPTRTSDKERQVELKKRGFLKKNVYLYPPRKACELSLSVYDLEHATMPEFFCVDVKSGKVRVNLEKRVDEALVRVLP